MVQENLLLDSLADADSLTPMMKQYFEIKSKHPDALLLYRMGDFYELFGEDALVASKILNIALTSRNKNDEKAIPMCGVPYHAVENYIPKLISAGYKVAICEQIEDPKTAKGLVKRAVTRIITPGLVLEDQSLSAKSPNYILAISFDRKWGIAYFDISTGEFKITELDTLEETLEELHRIEPKELLVPETERESIYTKIKQNFEVTLQFLPLEYFDKAMASEKLCSLFSVYSLDGFGLRDFSSGIGSAGALLRYAEENYVSLEHLRPPVPYRKSDFMRLDENTIKNLEIFYSQSFRSKKGSLTEVVDRTRTAMGGRMLNQWLRFPLIKKEEIVKRQEAIEELSKNPILLYEIASFLEKIGDIERIVSRIQTDIATPKDINALKNSLKPLPSIQNLIKDCKSEFLSEIALSWDGLQDIFELIDSILVDNPTANWISSSIIKEGVDPILDEYRALSKNSKEWLLKYEQQERERTGLTSLKVRYNKVFGYFIEISKSQAKQAPSNYHRKQTLVNAERFITEELKEFEIKILEADTKRQELEKEWFDKLKSQILSHKKRLQKMALLIGKLDSIVSLSDLALSENYTKPLVTEDGKIIIKGGRHPVLEKYLPPGAFVPNDIELNMEDQQILIITGPNMAGKSTILRQVALIVLLCQIGSFVPARSAILTVVDRIFTRIGTSDDLTRGRSTFMVEMQETAYILNQVTPESLVILDEIGRGTSTYDGMSIAWAVIEYLHDIQLKGVKTLCATHYHELTELSKELPRVKNFSVAVREWKDQIIFTYRLIPEKASKSYGIHVAKLAGLPPKVIERAKAILEKLENHHHEELKEIEYSLKPHKKPKRGFQLSLSFLKEDQLEEWLKEEILALDLDRTTPLTALQILYSIQQRLKGAGK